MFARERYGPHGLLVVVEKVHCCIYVAVSPAGGMENVAVAKANSAGRTEMNVGRLGLGLGTTLASLPSRRRSRCVGVLPPAPWEEGEGSAQCCGVPEGMRLLCRVAICRRVALALLSVPGERDKRSHRSSRALCV